MTRIVDISQEIFQGMQVYPGHLKTVVWDHASHEETRRLFDGGFSFASMGIMLCDHGPTHVDALSHLDPSPSAPSIDQMPLDLFYGPGMCVDVSDARPREYVTPEMLDERVARGGMEVQPGVTMLLYTGTYDRLAGTPEYTTQYPGLDEAASERLAQWKVKAFGVDSPSPDNPASRTYPCHMMCRAHGIHHYENLANLSELVGKTFTFAAFPLAVRGGTGSPVRAVAIFDD
jgi:kynurenine formamidase